MRAPVQRLGSPGATKLLGRFGFLGAAFGSPLCESVLVAVPFLSVLSRAH